MRLLLKHHNTEPTDQVSYLRNDIERPVQGGAFPSIGRDTLRPPPNGNLRAIVPGIHREQVRKRLPRHLKVDTSTRTIFNNDKTYDVHDAIADRTALGHSELRSSAPAATGHVPMTQLAWRDPRQQHMPPPTGPQVGPGSYNPHNAWVTTGMPPPGVEHSTSGPNPSHRNTTSSTSTAAASKLCPLSKDPDKLSPPFLATERGYTSVDLAVAKQTAGVPTYLTIISPAATTRNIVMSRVDRVVAPERWGTSAMDPRPSPDQLGDKLADPCVDMGGRASTCTAYTHNRDSRAYRAAFQSALPRSIALPAGSRSDTRLTSMRRNFAVSSGTQTHLGPGCYNVESSTRFQSWHAAAQGWPQYIPLGNKSTEYVKGQQDMPVWAAEQPVAAEPSQGRAASAGACAPAAPRSTHSPPHSQLSRHTSSAADTHRKHPGQAVSTHSYSQQGEGGISSTASAVHDQYQGAVAHGDGREGVLQQKLQSLSTPGALMASTLTPLPLPQHTTLQHTGPGPPSPEGPFHSQTTSTWPGQVSRQPQSASGSAASWSGVSTAPDLDWLVHQACVQAAYAPAQAPREAAALAADAAASQGHTVLSVLPSSAPPGPSSQGPAQGSSTAAGPDVAQQQRVAAAGAQGVGEAAGEGRVQEEEAHLHPKQPGSTQLEVLPGSEPQGGLPYDTSVSAAYSSESVTSVHSMWDMGSMSPAPALSTKVDSVGSAVELPWSTASLAFMGAQRRHDKLSFMYREVSHRSAVQGRLVAMSELKAARQAMRAVKQAVG